ncbi:MAG: aminoacyl-tRNA hydrolase [Gammaproteobacteria bacterium]
MPSSIKLLIGLGNCDPEYTRTRHNAGFWLLDKLAASSGSSFFRQARFHGDVSRVIFDDVDCRLIKPATYMNESGRAVQAVINYYKLAIEDALVVHDDIDLEPGVVRLKRGGGHGGHNGLRDIIDKVSSNDFLRLRIGIGHPGQPDAVTPYVLGRAGLDDQRMIDKAIDRALNCMPLIIMGEFEKAMNELHGSEKLKGESEK